MEVHLDINDVKITGPNQNLQTYPEEQFFTLLHSGNDMKNYLPLPEGFTCWNNGLLDGVPVYVCYEKQHLYLIVEDARQGFALFHYVSSDNPNNPGDYHLNYNLPYRKIKEREDTIIMANETLNAMAAQTRGRNITQMNLGGDVPAMSVVGEGITGAVDIQRLQREALASSYLAGYIMGSAPAITLSMPPKKQKDGTTTYSIVAKESKPSRMQGILMAVPGNLIMRAGSLATPSDILSGNVDYNSEDTQLVFNYFPLNAAKLYIAALGGRIAEYAPFVSDAKNQWTPEEILLEKEGVSFVQIRAIEQKNRPSGASERFRFSLKSTSPRNSLFTKKNHVCLRAFEHMPTVCRTEEEAFNLNQAAFGDWRYRRTKADTRTALEKAIAECPSTIWQQTYNINGEEVEGIGSVFFMTGQDATTANGEKVAKKELVYFPWDQTGVNRKSQPTVVSSIVKRVLRPEEGNKHERVVAIPVLWRDNPNHPMFREYKNFIDFIQSRGFIREDALRAMSGRATAKKKSYALSHDQMESLRSYLNKEDVVAEINRVKDAASDKAILANVSR